MPKNNDLEPVKFPMKHRFGEAPTTEVKNDLRAIRVTLLDHPDPMSARKMVYQFVNATWDDSPDGHDPNKALVRQWQLNDALEAALQGRALPTVLETLGFTFRIEGIDLQTVTHLIRHRAGSFSAQCTGDRWQTHSAALVPGPIQNSPELYERWVRHVEDAKRLYCDMIDTRKISIMDARTILPRCIETHYYVRLSLKDLIQFVYQRMDKQIQPTTDNVIAYQMFIETAKVFPELTTVVHFHVPSKHYVRTARTGKATNLYFPDDDSDEFEYNERDFIYQCRRDEVNGTDPDLGRRENFEFTKMQREYDAKIEEIVRSYNLYKQNIQYGVY